MLQGAELISPSASVASERQGLAGCGVGDPEGVKRSTPRESGLADVLQPTTPHAVAVT